MKIMTLTDKNKDEIITAAISILHAGGLVVVPSDTVYGMAVDATNDEAVKRLIKLKARPPGKAISIFCGTIERLASYVNVSASQKKLITTLLPGPYTLVLQSLHKVSRLVESERGTLGVRVPESDFVNELVNTYGIPVTATSANRAGQSPHYSIDALLNSLSQEKKALIDLVIDAGKLPFRKPSTVVDMTKESFKILREGDFGSILQLIGGKESYDSKSEEETRQLALKIIKSNYHAAKDKPLVFVFTGTLGAGKTVFIKAMATFLNIEDVVSPTFVIYYEYDVDIEPIKKLIHADLYRITEDSEFDHLGLEEYMAPGNILCIEWSEKSEIFLQKYKNTMNCVYIDIAYTGPTSRHITIQKNFSL